MAAPTTNKPTQTTQKADKADKPKHDPKPLLVRLDEQLTRATVAKKVTHDELAKFEQRVGRLRAFLEE